MTRVAHFGARFRKAADRLGVVPNSERGRAVGQTIAALLDADALPGPRDIRALMPPTGEAFVRRVPGRNLWVWYRADDETLYLAHLSSDPPVPVDE
ncbi:MAG: hypothetical protein ACRENE_05145 [Polyangiaceae bacterium]